MIEHLSSNPRHRKLWYGAKGALSFPFYYKGSYILYTQKQTPISKPISAYSVKYLYQLLRDA